MKVDDLHLACSFTIMEGRDVDLLFGLDMLKAHQACIDLEKNVLRIQGREVKFLAEHELPDKARVFETGEGEPPQPGPPSVTSPPNQPAPRPFPGAGNTLGGNPEVGGIRGIQPQPQQTRSRYSEVDIQTIMSLGASRELAIRTLDAAGGNLDIAASMLF